MRKFTLALALAAAASLSTAQQALATLATMTMQDPDGRAPTAAELASDGTLAGKTVYEFFVTTDSDILSINQVTIVGALYQHSLGSDTEPPAPAFVTAFPALSADSWISTPGATSIAGTGSMTTPNSTWFDSQNNGAQTNFMYARLTTAEPAWSFQGRISLAATPDPVPFQFLFQGVPEPSSIAMAGMGLIGIVGAGIRRRMKA